MNNYVVTFLIKCNSHPWIMLSFNENYSQSSQCMKIFSANFINASTIELFFKYKICAGKGCSISHPPKISNSMCDMKLRVLLGLSLK